MPIEIILNETTKNITQNELFDLAVKGEISPGTPIIVDGKHATAGDVIGGLFRQTPPPLPTRTVSPSKASVDDLEELALQTIQEYTIPPIQNNRYSSTEIGKSAIIEILIDGKTINTVTSEELFTLAREETIDPKTIIRVNGTLGKARDVQGIVFGQHLREKKRREETRLREIERQERLRLQKKEHEKNDNEPRLTQEENVSQKQPKKGTWAESLIGCFIWVIILVVGLHIAGNITSSGVKYSKTLSKESILLNRTEKAELFDLYRRLGTTDVHAKRFDKSSSSIYITSLLELAVQDASPVVVKYLINRGADVNTKGILHNAIFHGKIEVVKILVEKGANVNAKDTLGGKTPLHSAVFCGNIETARFLLTNGANINATDDYGQTPLHVAADRGEIEAVRFLVANGANPNARDDSDHTPLDEAMSTMNSIKMYGTDYITRNFASSERDHIEMNTKIVVEFLSKITQ